MIITKAQLAILYAAINASGAENATRLKAATQSADRFALALNMLRIPYKNLRYNDQDGYKYDADPAAGEMIRAIIENPSLLNNGIDYFHNQQSENAIKREQASRRLSGTNQPVERPDPYKNHELPKPKVAPRKLTLEDYELAALALTAMSGKKLGFKASTEPFSVYCTTIVTKQDGPGREEHLRKEAAKILKKSGIHDKADIDRANRREFILASIENPGMYGDHTTDTAAIRFTDPAVILHYSNLYRQAYLNPGTPVPGKGVSQQIGASAMMLVAGGITQEKAQKGEGIANIALGQDGSLTLNIPDSQYASLLATTLRMHDFSSVEFRDINLSTKFGNYTGAVIIKDPAEVKRFVESVCGYPQTATENLFTANKKNLSDFVTLKDKPSFKPR